MLHVLNTYINCNIKPIKLAGIKPSKNKYLLTISTYYTLVKAIKFASAAVSCELTLARAARKFKCLIETATRRRRVICDYETSSL